MESPASRQRSSNLAKLVEAVLGNRHSDSLSRFLPPDAWEVLATYISRRTIEQGKVLIGQGTLDRTVFIVETGMLRVQYLKADAELEIAQLGPGAVIGEGAFFSDIPRNATVQATQDSTLWELTPDKFRALSKDDPPMALTVAMALGAVLATRMLDISKKVAVT